ncbi:MAG: oxygen-independent coproporphyrinogen III oxidase [SAR324 cluster bacterium]|uniref:Coproporphyrinogen-III oxidase n=1 Tax=SAR324 cluster bacterium TaxID=2024889 RepID=A0A2A4TAD0_9DELT|nr:MAG: oxygen-independent coproporphyrinogen III oxidase [SAR324 cluster bacterium]
MFRISDELIKKYSVIGPRYTSYPTAPMWYEIEPSKQLEWYSEIRASTRPLSLYIHIPFCWERCVYCACNVFITKQQGRSKNYVEYLLGELDSLASFQHSEKKIRQLHFGGGTPNFLLDEEFKQILEKIRSLFTFEEDAEIAIEMDPSMMRPGQLKMLRELGFNRLSMGVQDFNEKVQKAVKREQSAALTLEVLQEARALGYKGINFDLIYGLPHQTPESFRETLDTVIAMRPDRLAVYNFAYLPEQMPHQRKIDPTALPGEKEKLDFLFAAIEKFTTAGYRYIGMDHFALEDDELSVAQKNHTLYRNFMGYTPKSGVDLFGIGASSIGEFGRFFLQNEKKVNLYQKRIEDGGLSGSRGIVLTKDDQIRKWTIIRLICHFYLSFEEFKAEFGEDFREYFQSELGELEAMQADGLLEVKEDHIEILDPGKILVRNICMVFDAYLKRSNVPKVTYSKTI